MTPAQRALILAALGLTPRDGVMPRWSCLNRRRVDIGGDDYRIAEGLARTGMMEPGQMTAPRWSRFYHVTRLGAEAAGVLGRCRWEHLS